MIVAGSPRIPGEGTERVPLWKGFGADPLTAAPSTLDHEHSLVGFGALLMPSSTRFSAASLPYASEGGFKFKRNLLVGL
jgi:hypothetical protein